MSFSDLLKTVEKDVTGLLLPKDAPSDTREADALAKAAEGVATTVDPELAPLFDRIGVLGDYVEQALHELGTVAGKIKTTIATRAQQVPPPLTPTPVASEPSEPSDGSAEPSTEATSSAADPTGDPSTTTEPGASMSDVTPPAAPSPAPDPAPADPIPVAAETSDGAPVETVPAPAPAATPGLAPASAVGPDAALSGAEAAFDALDPADQAAFETAEDLQAAVADAQAGSTPPPPA